MLTLLAVFGILSLIVAVHEFGHLVAARLCGVHVYKYSIGFGRALPGLRRRIGATEYQIGWLPLGGFVAVASRREKPPAGHEPVADEHTIEAQTFRVRAIILLAGIALNIVLGSVLIGIAIGGARGGFDLGVLDTALMMPGQALVMFWQALSTIGPKDVHTVAVVGPLTAHAASVGWEAVVLLAGLISIEVAIFNALPIPVTDGGQLLIAAWERVSGRRLSRVAHRNLCYSAYAVVLGILLVGLVNDARAYRVWIDTGSADAVVTSLMDERSAP